jgi:hypothetical protein
MFEDGRRKPFATGIYAYIVVLIRHRSGACWVHEHARMLSSDPMRI